MAINKKLLHFVSKANFSTQLANSNIDSKSIVFIKDTGEIWTHDKLYSCASWGTNQTNYVPLTIGGTSYNISKDGHTHSYVPLSGASYIQSTGNSTSWGVTNGTSTGAFNAIMGTGSSATWLLSGTSGGVFKSGIQSLDSSGTMRFYVGSNYMQYDGSSLYLGGNNVWYSGNHPTTLANYGITDGLFTEQVSVAQTDDTWVKGYIASRKKALVYNTSGVEWGYLFNFRNDGLYGSVLSTSYSNNTLKMLTINAGTWGSWVTFIHSGNIGSQSVSHATTATNLSSISTTFTGTYPLTVNVSGTIYSHTGMTFNGTTGNLTATSFTGSLIGNATTATSATTAGSTTVLKWIGDKRAGFKPSDISANSFVQTFSSQGSLINQTIDSDWVDVLGISSYIDSGGGQVSALTFDKSSFRISHFMGSFAGATWSGYKTLAYTDGTGASGTWGISITGNASTATALTSSAGSSTNPIYFSSGKPTASTYSFGNASGNIPISNGTLNTNLNADLLDGKHDGEITAAYFAPKILSSANTLDNISDGVWFYTNGNNPTNSVGDNSALLQIGSRWWDRFQLAFPGNNSNSLHFRSSTYESGSSRYWNSWKTIAFTDSNVESANKLKTPRTIWGQNFDGSGNVSGALSGATTGSFSDRLTAKQLVSTDNIYLPSGYCLYFDYGVTNNFYIKKSGSNLTYNATGGIHNFNQGINSTTGSFSGLLSSYNNQIIGTGGTGDAYLELWRGTSASWKMLNSSGTLYFQSNYTSTIGDYYDVMTLSYNSGNMWVKGLVNAVGGLQVNGNNVYHTGNFSVTLNGSSTTSANFYAPTAQLSVQASTNSYLIGATSTTSLNTVYSNAGIYMNGSKLFTGDIQASGNVTAANLWGISSKDITIALTTDWQDTGILLNDSILFSDGDGTYIIELYTNSYSVGSGYSMRYSGTMAVYTGSTNSTNTDEIILNSSGHSDTGRHIYLRTANQITPNYAKLQMSVSNNWTGSGTITIKTRRII